MGPAVAKLKVVATARPTLIARNGINAGQAIAKAEARSSLTSLSGLANAICQRSSDSCPTKRPKQFRIMVKKLHRNKLTNPNHEK